MRILAIDWGEVRVGVAISDEGGSIAFPLDKILESKNAAVEIKKIIDERAVEQIIIGYPKTLAGEAGASSEKVSRFIEELKKTIKVPIELVDERLSSVAATKTLQSQGMREKDQRSIKDNIAAQLILQQYLDNIKLKI